MNNLTLNPWLKMTWNLTEQMRLLTHDPALAARLQAEAAQAGVAATTSPKLAVQQKDRIALIPVIGKVLRGGALSESQIIQRAQQLAAFELDDLRAAVQRMLKTGALTQTNGLIAIKTF